METYPHTVALFIPCLVDQVYPAIGRAMASVLRRAGVRVTYDARQTCCGQPAFNSGYRDEALQVAKHFLEVFAAAPCIVTPSGSCAAMVRKSYAQLFAAHESRDAAARMGQKVFEFSEFLVHQLQRTALGATYARKVGFHNSCHSYRELGISQEPLALLRAVQGLTLHELPGEPVCCGFGGLFSFKFATIAEAMTHSRIEAFEKLGVDAIVSNDPGCIMQMRQAAQTRERKLEILHLAEVLNQV